MQNRKIKTNNILLFALFISTFLTSCFKGEEADLIIHNAKIHSLDDEYTIYQAMAIKDGKIIDLGPEREILNKYSGESIDAKQKSIYPSFTDGHGHLTGAAKSNLMTQLYGLTSHESIVSALKKYNTDQSEGWIFGRGWNQETLPNKRMLNKFDLDKAFPNTPVFLIRIDGHAAVVNSKALELAGIDSTTTIYGGQISDDGFLLDNAMELVSKKAGQFKEELIVRELKKVQNTLLSYGITSVHEAGIGVSDYNRYMKLINNNQLDLFIYAMMQNDSTSIDFLVKNGKIDNEHLSIRSIKAYADGAMGSRGACMKSPYLDDTTSTGLILIKEEKLNQLAQFCIENKIQLNTHCIGDSAFSWVAKIYAQHLEKGNDYRWRIEHAQVFDPKDLYLLKEYNIIPSVQPCHAISDAAWVRDRIGDREQYAYNYRKLKENSSILISGTDFPIESPDPFRNYFSGFKRQNLDLTPENGYNTRGALSKKEMIKSMTVWPQFGSFTESTNGSLKKGKYADFIILNQDFMSVPDEKVKSTYVVKTFIKGREVYSAE